MLKEYKLGDLIEVSREASLAGEHYATEGKYKRITLGNFNYKEVDSKMILKKMISTVLAK